MSDATPLSTPTLGHVSLSSEISTPRLTNAADLVQDFPKRQESVRTLGVGPIYHK